MVINDFDVASLNEIKLIKKIKPDAKNCILCIQLKVKKVFLLHILIMG